MSVYTAEFHIPSIMETVLGLDVKNASTPDERDCAGSRFGIKQAAEYIGMSPKWLYKHYADLPHVRIGYGTKPRIKFRRCDLDAWIRQHRIG
jgi:hypothetical protein